MLQQVFHLLLTMLAFAAAAPIEAETAHNSWQYGVSGGIIGFIIFVLDIIVFVEVLQSSRPVLHKVLWCLLVFLFPIGGLIIYWLFSNRSAHRRGYDPIS